MALTKIKADGLTADLIDETKLADNSIDSEHYNDGSIDNAHLAADAVTGAKIADDAVGAEHIEQLDADLQFIDNEGLLLGTGDDAALKFNGTDTLLTTAGKLKLYPDGNLEILDNSSGECRAKFIDNGAVELYHDDSNVCETMAGGIKLTDTELTEASDNFSINIQSGNNDFYVKSGGTTFAAFKGSAKDLQLTSGNLVIGTSGKGIDFSAQTGTGGGAGSSTEAELLNHYEEGKLNATAISSGLTFTTGGNTNKNLHYVRIGNWVTVSGYLEVSSFTSDSTGIQIQMPFTSAGNSDGYYTRGVGATMAASINLPSTAYLTAYVGGGENYMRLYYTQDDANYHQMVNSDLTNSSGIYFSLSYGI